MDILKCIYEGSKRAPILNFISVFKTEMRFKLVVILMFFYR
ncbi:hypothetical protein JCM19300_2896 [Algibacter lectus]|uniref:Uncharacterized protein n=1 Tax=Algibacter lectus TaxID=221126 RepID=A0A090VBF5_9FLAO|nr:hypothetical protein JCM19300_2896 [Algibacter lectus]